MNFGTAWTDSGYSVLMGTSDHRRFKTENKVRFNNQHNNIPIVLFCAVSRVGQAAGSNDALIHG
jgi:hypothetical protein